MVNQGGMINQPAVDRETGEFFEIQTDDRGYEYYLTEIARRFAVTTNSVKAAINAESGLSAMLIFKQGIINQGGPADIFLRRVIYREEFTVTEDTDGDAVDAEGVRRGEHSPGGYSEGVHQLLEGRGVVESPARCAEVQGGGIEEVELRPVDQ